jgi:hypothetical protein
MHIEPLETSSSWDSRSKALEYGLPFGRKGDVIGALLEWKA